MLTQIRQMDDARKHTLPCPDASVTAAITAIFFHHFLFEKKIKYYDKSSRFRFVSLFFQLFSPPTPFSISMSLILYVSHSNSCCCCRCSEFYVCAKFLDDIIKQRISYDYFEYGKNIFVSINKNRAKKKMNFHS